MEPLFFKSHVKFREWLAANHQKQQDVWVGYYKVNSGKSGLTWSQSVDEALCYGWIDSVRKSIDNESYCIRFTPRKQASVWSAVNIKKVEALIKLGLMKPEGMVAFSKRKEEKSKIYSFETEPKELTPELEKIFRANKKAWHFFIQQPPSHRKTLIHWIVSAKQEKTKWSRLQKLITDCEQKRRTLDKYKK